MQLRLILLGRPQIELNGQDVNGRLPVKARILFYYLVSNPQTHNRNQLAEWIWDGAANPRGSLRVALRALRDRLGKGIVTGGRDTLAINHDYNYSLDVEEFDNLIQLAEKVVGATERAHLRDAVELFQGDFLQDVVIDGAFLYDEWLLPERERLRQRALSAYDRLLEVCREQGDYEAGIRYSQALLQLEPWRESAHRQLMRFYDLTGKRSLAINQFDALEDVLAEKFDVSPADETFALYRQIVDPQVAGVTKPLAVSGEAGSPVPFLAPKLAPFFSGRDTELADLQEKLRLRESRRMIGLVGAPGVGKTALAIELAHRLRPVFPDGVLWMNADLDDPMSVAERWANAYGYNFSRISDVNERTAVLRDLLSEKQALIICDDVTNAARTRPFLPEKGQSTILLTSRSENLIRRLGAELVNVKVMSLVNGRALLASIITEERVAAEEEAAAEILTLLEGLPLAIAIAGQRLAQHSRRKLALFAAQLRDESTRIDLADRDRAIRTSFAVSWNGLDQIQQQVFARLAVFAGRSFAVDAVTAIAEMDYFQALDRLDALVALSLLNDVGDERYRQHVLLADFAREKLGQDDSPYRRMVVYYKAFAYKHGQEYERLEPEWENLSTCITQAHHLELWKVVIEFSELLREAWFAQGLYTEAREAFRSAVKAAQNLGDEHSLAYSQIYWGHACIEQNEYELGRELLTNSLQRFVELNYPEGIAATKSYLARIALELSQNKIAEDLLAESSIIWEQLRNQAGLAQIYFRQARIKFRQGENGIAKEIAQRALEIQQAAHDERGSIPTYRLLVSIAINQQDFELAKSYGLTALDLCEKWQDRAELALVFNSLANAYRGQCEYKLAESFAFQGIELLKLMGDRRSLAVVYYELSRLYIEQELFSLAVEWGERSLSLAQVVQDQLLEALALTFIGDGYANLNQSDQAEKMWHRAMILAEQLNLTNLLESLRSRLGL